MRVIWVLLAWSLVEIGLYAAIGGKIGVLATWGLVLGSAALGLLVIRRQKRVAMGQIVQDLQRLGDPLTPAAHSALLVLAGVLLILPGFLTDAMGLLLLLPPVREALILWLRQRARMATMDSAVNAMLHPRRPAPDADVIDVVAEEVSPKPRPPHKPSGWTKS